MEGCDAKVMNALERGGRLRSPSKVRPQNSILSLSLWFVSFLGPIAAACQRCECAGCWYFPGVPYEAYWASEVRWCHPAPGKCPAKTTRAPPTRLVSVCLLLQPTAARFRAVVESSLFCSYHLDHLLSLLHHRPAVDPSGLSELCSLLVVAFAHV